MHFEAQFFVLFAKASNEPASYLGSSFNNLNADSNVNFSPSSWKKILYAAFKILFSELSFFYVDTTCL